MKVFFIFFSLAMLVFMFMYSKNGKEPKNLGLEDNNFYELSNKPNCISSQTKYKEKRVQTIPFKSSFSKTKEDLMDTIKTFKNTEIITMDECYIHIVFSSSIFKFKDDVELYLDTSNKVVHYRSASRVGYSDMGANKKRYQKFIDIYNSI